MGFTPSEDPQAHNRWVDENLSAAWNLAGPQNRVGYVSYIGGVPSDRLGSINVSPPTLFGNYGSSQVHKLKQKTFAMHGHGVLGGAPVYAEWMGREIISNVTILSIFAISFIFAIICLVIFSFLLLIFSACEVRRGKNSWRNAE